MTVLLITEISVITSRFLGSSNDFIRQVIFLLMQLPIELMFTLLSIVVFVGIYIATHVTKQEFLAFDTAGMRDASQYISQFIRQYKEEKDQISTLLMNQKTQKRVMVPSKNHEHDMIFMLDASAHFIYANKETLMSFHCTIEDILGESIFRIYEKNNMYDRTWYDTLPTLLSTNNIIKISKDGTDTWLHMKYHANLNVLGEIESVMVTGSDVTSIMNSDTIKHFYSGQDQSTGLMNQYGMYEYIKQMSHMESAVSFFIEIKHYTEIIDYYGHIVANQLIQDVIEDLRSIVSKHCSIVRYTDAKFVVLCFNGDTSPKRLDKYLDKLADFLHKSYKIDSVSLQIEKHIGYAMYPQDTKSIEEMISLSSIALKNAVDINAVEVVRYQPTMMEQLKYNLELAAKLKKALDDEIIEVYFQKAIDCTNQEVFIIEELSRWKDKDLGYISPLEFFRIAKETNQLDRLDRYMVKKSIDAFSKLKRNHAFLHAKLTINLAPNTLLNLKFFEFFNQVVEQSGLATSDIYIEISESTFVNQLDLCIERINAYKALGYLIALDDFGIEYSSLAILERVNFDIIKIDAHFVKNISKINNQEIIKMIRRITTLNHKEMIAEGVETKAQSDLLKELGCLIQQGYYLHRPENLTYLEQ